ncbi:protein of unknown function [Methylorubrum extorquens]|uniref:Uncharacterized protein n=1 Tax=Methylorubrum extorquens TaxID=408 RepID=A0A2N9AMX7_METEX|nr:protein of unknown function [Methylorubrum extorquens]
MIQRHPDLGLDGAHRYAEADGDGTMAQAFQTTEPKRFRAPRRHLSQGASEALAFDSRQRSVGGTRGVIGDD